MLFVEQLLPQRVQLGLVASEAQLAGLQLGRAVEQRALRFSERRAGCSHLRKRRLLKRVRQFTEASSAYSFDILKKT